MWGMDLVCDLCGRVSRRRGVKQRLGLRLRDKCRVMLSLPTSIGKPLRGRILPIDFLADFWSNPDELGSKPLNCVHRIDRIHVQSVAIRLEIDGPDHSTI